MHRLWCASAARLRSVRPSAVASSARSRTATATIRPARATLVAAACAAPCRSRCAHTEARRDVHTRAAARSPALVSAFPSAFAFAAARAVCSRRSLHSSASVCHLSTADPNGADVHVTFITPDGERHPAVGKEGENLLALAHANAVELEGACEASLACSTCHVILPDKYFKKLPEAVDEENDMLDLAFGLTDTSRLGCQVKLTKELEGMEIKLPAATRNMSVDGFKPKPH